MKQDYLTYKKKKLGEIPVIEKPKSQKNFLPLGIVIFVICFVIVIKIAAHYGSRVDIEYGKFSNSENAQETFGTNADSVVSGEVDGRFKIDSRLKSLQVSETSPISPIVQEKTEEMTATEIMQTAQNPKETMQSQEELQETHKIVYSKVLLGRYATFDEAKTAQAKLREDAGIQAFVRKMGSVYALQVGSYLDTNQAKQVATKFSNMDYQVWILED